MERKSRAARAALYGLLIALAMGMSFIESLIPLPMPAPGMKLGFANLVTVTGLYLVGIPGTIWVTVIRIILVGFSFGNPYSMIYGLSGSILSLTIMSLVKKHNWFSPIGVSILGGVAHNIGQLIFASFVVRTSGLYYYLPFLLPAGCVAGAVIGVVGGILTERISDFVNRIS